MQNREHKKRTTTEIETHTHRHTDTNTRTHTDTQGIKQQEKIRLHCKKCLSSKNKKINEKWRTIWGVTGN